MSVTVPVVYKGCYMGRNTPAQTEYILATRNLKDVPELKNYILKVPDNIIMQSIEEEKSARDIIKDAGLNIADFVGEMRDYQTVGTSFMYLSARSILGDTVGLGKTVELAGLINLLYSKKELTRFLIAVENSALGQTQAELIRFTGLNIVVLPAERPKLEKKIKKTDWTKVHGIVIKHSTLRSDGLSTWIAKNLSPDGKGNNIFNTFILDESSVIKNDQTKIYSYTQEIANVTPRVHFLNATCFETKLLDMYYQLDVLNPDLLPRKTAFQKEYCIMGRSNFWTKAKDPITGLMKPKQNFRFTLDGYRNQAIFKNKVQMVYFARSKEDVGLNIQHEYKVYKVEATAKQKTAIKIGHRYMEVLNNPSLIPELNLETCSKNVPKMARCVDLITNSFDTSKVLVYCFHREAQRVLQRELEEAGKKVALIHGQTSDDDRFLIQNQFNLGQIDVLITSIKKSLNLYGGDVCIFYTVETNPAKMEQIRGRIDRNINDNQKTFVLLVYEDTDEERYLMNVIKQRAADARELTIDAKTAIDYFIDVVEDAA